MFLSLLLFDVLLSICALLHITIRLRAKEKAENNKVSLDNRLSLNEDLEYKTPISSIKYSKESIRIAIYLIILKKPKNISRTEFYKFKRKVLKYRVYRQKL